MNSQPFNKKKNRNSARSRLVKASRMVIEGMEQRVMMSAFTPGDIAVVRVGAAGGGGALVDTGSAVFIDEYTTGGSLVQTISLPTTSTAGGNQALVLGNNTSEGELSLSTDQKDLLLTGYDTTPLNGGTKIENSLTTGGSAIFRTVAEISASGSVNTTTALTDFASGGDPRGVAGSDTAGFWLGGQDASTGGVRYIGTLGTSVTTSVNLTGTPLANARGVEIWNGQLYLSQNKASGTIIQALDSSTGSLQEPSTGTPTINSLPGASNAAGLIETSSSGANGNAKTGAFFFAA